MNSRSTTVSVLLRQGTTPVEVENLEATARAGSVQLRWKLALGARRELFGIDIQRATAAAGPYVVVSAAPLPSAIEMSFEDVGLESGSYWYRLVLIARHGARVLAGPVGVQVGSDPQRVTRLLQLVEPAGGGPVQIRYSLAGARTLVRLAVFDVRGRVVWSNAAVREPGEHTQTWERRDRSGLQTPRGMYFIGLDAGGVKDSRKFVLVVR